jgi:hypothetical protein
MVWGYLNDGQWIKQFLRFTNKNWTEIPIYKHAVSGAGRQKNIFIYMTKFVFSSLLASALLPATVSAQSISYTYDAAGNRIQRSYAAARSSVAPTEEAAEISAEEPAVVCDLRLYPNPTDGLLTVEITGFTAATRARIELYSSTGRLLDRLTEVEAVNTLDMTAFPAGVYFLRAEIDDRILSRKVIKK